MAEPVSAPPSSGVKPTTALGTPGLKTSVVVAAPAPAPTSGRKE